MPIVCFIGLFSIFDDFSAVVLRGSAIVTGPMKAARITLPGEFFCPMGNRQLTLE